MNLSCVGVVRGYKFIRLIPYETIHLFIYIFQACDIRRSFFRMLFRLDYLYPRTREVHQSIPLDESSLNTVIMTIWPHSLILETDYYYGTVLRISSLGVPVQ